MAFRIALDSIACIGCVACTQCEHFEMQTDMKAHAVRSVVKESGCVLEVAASCPVGAIVVTKIS
jgi:ferredoxin